MFEDQLIPGYFPFDKIKTRSLKEPVYQLPILRWQVLCEIDWRTGDGCLDLNEFIDQMCWHTPFQIRELMPKYEYKKAHRREVLLRCGLQKDIVTKPVLQVRSQRESTCDKHLLPCKSDSCQREKSSPNLRPKDKSVPQGASDLSSEMGGKVLVTTNTDEPPQRIKLKMSVEGLSDSEVLTNEADNPAHCSVPDVPDSAQVPREQTRNSLSNSRFHVSKPAQGHPRSEHVCPENSNEDWDAVGAALKSNDSTFNMKNMSRTGLWPAKPTLRTRTISDTVHGCCSQSQSLSALTSRKVIAPAHDELGGCLAFFF